MPMLTLTVLLNKQGEMACGARYANSLPALPVLLRYHQLSGGSEKLQVGALLGAFQVVRELLTNQAS